MKTVAIAAAATLGLFLAAEAGAQSDQDGLPSLSLSARGKALQVQSKSPLGIYAIVAGLGRAKIPLPNGLVLAVSPDLLLVTGVLDKDGIAVVPIELRNAALAGTPVHFQAGIWTSLPDSLLPDRLTNPLSTVFLDPADIPKGPDADDPVPALDVVDLSADHDPEVQLLSTDSIPPVWSVELRVKVKAAKAELRFEPIACDPGQPGMVALKAELLVSEGKADKKGADDGDTARILTAGRELGTDIRHVVVYFASRTVPSGSAGGDGDR